MDIPRFHFDYSFLNLDELASQCITTEEIQQLFYDLKSRYDDFMSTDRFGYVIGYTSKNKFISFTFELVGDDTVRLTQVYLSYEQEIFNRYFFR
ncbi:hypothetical protein [Spirosoma gilvum]